MHISEMIHTLATLIVADEGLVAVARNKAYLDSIISKERVRDSFTQGFEIPGRYVLSVTLNVTEENEHEVNHKDGTKQILGNLNAYLSFSSGISSDDEQTAKYLELLAKLHRICTEFNTKYGAHTLVLQSFNAEEVQKEKVNKIRSSLQHELTRGAFSRMRVGSTVEVQGMGDYPKPIEFNKGEKVYLYDGTSKVTRTR